MIMELGMYSVIIHVLVMNGSMAAAGHSSRIHFFCVWHCWCERGGELGAQGHVSRGQRDTVLLALAPPLHRLVSVVENLQD